MIIVALRVTTRRVENSLKIGYCHPSGDHPQGGKFEIAAPAKAALRRCGRGIWKLRCDLHFALNDIMSIRN